MEQNLLFPHIGVVTDIRRDTPDVKTFRVNAIGGGKCFEHIPGQCAMLSIPGKGEAMFSITSSPTNREYMEFSIKKMRLPYHRASPHRGGSGADHPRPLRQRLSR